MQFPQYSYLFINLQVYDTIPGGRFRRAMGAVYSPHHAAQEMQKDGCIVIKTLFLCITICSYLLKGCTHAIILIGQFLLTKLQDSRYIC